MDEPRASSFSFPKIFFPILHLCCGLSAAFVLLAFCYANHRGVFYFFLLLRNGEESKAEERRGGSFIDGNYSTRAGRRNFFKRTLFSL
jgi:hypothetical protein